MSALIYHCIAKYQKLLAHNKHLLSHRVSVGQQLGSGFVRWSWLEGSHDAPVVSQGSSLLKAGLRWEYPLCVGSLVVSMLVWAFGRRPQSIPRGPPHRSTWVSSAHGHWLSQGEWSEKEKDGSYTGFYVLAFQVTHSHFPQYPSGSPSQPDLVWKRNI